LNTHYTYFLILAASLAGPLALSFDKKVAFYKKWKYVLSAMLLPALFYIIWDAWFTSLGVWSFNKEYITGIYLFHLPLEEILFFFVVPYCCIFIYECIRVYFPKLQTTIFSEKLLFTIGVFLFVAALAFNKPFYTFYTAIFSAAFIFLLFMLRRKAIFFNSAAFLVSYAIILLPFLAINGLLTSIPVVIYNDAQNLSFRIFTIPVEDIFYGMLLVLMNIVLYEKFKTSAPAA
jgi:lycopene cyclase domain-containing protein